jgi:hypothetical protein
MLVGGEARVNNVLLSAGAACVIVAIVGGGAKAFGVEVPVLGSVRRQVALGIAGIGFLAAAFVVGSGPTGSSPANPVNPAVVAYRQEVLAACRTAQSGASGNALMAAANSDGTFDRDRFMAALRDQITASSSVWQDLWKHPAPNELRAEASAAQQAANDEITQTRAAVDKIPAQLPARFTIEELAAFSGRLDAALRAPTARLEGALAELAGQPCGVPTPAASG